MDGHPGGWNPPPNSRYRPVVPLGSPPHGGPEDLIWIPLSISDTFWTQTSKWIQNLAVLYTVDAGIQNPFTGVVHVTFDETAVPALENTRLSSSGKEENWENSVSRLCQESSESNSGDQSSQSDNLLTTHNYNINEDSTASSSTS